MSPRERRIVHMALRDIKGVRTESMGKSRSGACRSSPRKAATGSPEPPPSPRKPPRGSQRPFGFTSSTFHDSTASVSPAYGGN
jgi:hypothetical protein